MLCLLIFDHKNDVVFSKLCEKSVKHLKSIAVESGLIQDDQNDINIDVLIHMFAPIVTSHRIKNCQFGNSYASIKCQNDASFKFEDYMGYLFLSIESEVAASFSFLSACVSLVKYICGPDVSKLNDENKNSLLNDLIDRWLQVREVEQAPLVEAIEQLCVNNELTKATIQALRGAVDRLSSSVDSTKVHGLLLVDGKFLGLYSSQNARELSPCDLIFTILLSDVRSDRNRTEGDVYSYQVLLSMCDPTPKCVPHVVLIKEIYDGIILTFLIEENNAKVASCLCECFRYTHSLQLLKIPEDPDTVKTAVDNFDNSIKRLTDSVKKSKCNSLKAQTEHVTKGWELTKRKYQDYVKTADTAHLWQAESSTKELLRHMRELLSRVDHDDALAEASLKRLDEPTKIVIDKLSSYEDFLKVKAMKNSFSLEPYLEEFPGLVHFVYVDRTNHRFTGPFIDDTRTGKGALKMDKVKSMVRFARAHLVEGHTSLIWKDATFCYSYFLWFEDLSGSPMKLNAFPSALCKPMSKPGLFCSDFYEQLKVVCFPKVPPNKIRCYEIYCVHLGLVTAQIVLEHARRLSATIWELKGHPNHPIDLL